MKIDEAGIIAAAHVVLALQGKGCQDLENSLHPDAAKAKADARAIIAAYENTRSTRFVVTLRSAAGLATAVGLMAAIAVTPVVVAVKALLWVLP